MRFEKTRACNVYCQWSNWRYREIRRNQNFSTKNPCAHVSAKFVRFHIIWRRPVGGTHEIRRLGKHAMQSSRQAARLLARRGQAALAVGRSAAASAALKRRSSARIATDRIRRSFVICLLFDATINDPLIHASQLIHIVSTSRAHKESCKATKFEPQT